MELSLRCRADGCNAVDPEDVPAFTDVKPTDYFYKAVMRAARLGITTDNTDSHGIPTASSAPTTVLPADRS